MRSKGAGPGGENNQIIILDKHTKTYKFKLKPKAEVAKDITNYIISCLKK